MSGRRRATCSVIQCMVMRIWRRYARCLTAMLLSVFVFYSLLCLSPNVWEIEPTLDNRWGDFALPTTTSIGVERWVFRHMVEPLATLVSNGPTLSGMTRTGRWSTRHLARTASGRDLTSQSDCQHR